MITAYIAPSYRGWRRGGPGSRLERRRRDAEQDARDAWPGIGVPVRDPRGMRDRITGLEAVVLRPDPQVQNALEHDHDLLVGVVRIGFVARPAAGLDRGHDHLEAPIGRAGQELVDGTQALVDDPAALADADHDPGALVGGEELRNRLAERSCEALQRGDGRRRGAARHLGEDALGDAGLRRQLAEGRAAGDAQGPDARPEIDLDRWRFWLGLGVVSHSDGHGG